MHGIVRCISSRLNRGCCLFLLYAGMACQAADSADSRRGISVNELPDSLRSVWVELKPEMTPMSHCAAAFDSYTDAEKMVFRCSIYIRMSAEGERRALRYCEDKRLEKGIKMACRLVEE